MSARVFVGSEGLKGKGIRYCPDHLRRLYEADSFPKPFRFPSSTRKLWFEDEIDAYLAKLAAQRPQAAA